MSLYPYKIVALRRIDEEDENVFPYASFDVRYDTMLVAPVYSNSSGSPFPMPLLCDANGEANIWLEDGQYKISVGGSDYFDVYIGDDFAAIGEFLDIDGKEVKSNKVQNLIDPNTVDYPSTLAVANAISDISSGQSPQGAWNASTNTPTLTSSVGTAGHYYEVSVNGTTNLNGENAWEVGDKAIFNGFVWTRIPANSVRSVDGQTGNVVLNTDTRLTLSALSLPVGSKVSTKGCDAVGDGGHGTFIVTDVEPAIVDGYSGILMANSNWAVLQQPWNILNFGVSGGLISPAGNRAVAALGAIGGGSISIPAGSYTANNESGSPASWDSRYAIYINADNISFVGEGVGKTKITLNNGQDCHVFKIGTRTGGTVVVNNIVIKGMEIDGNRSNQTIPDDTNYHNGAFDVANDCTKIALKNLYLHDVMYYGIGFQREGFHDCKVENVVIEDTGGDGIDWKDDAQTNTGNFINNLTVRRPGLIAGLSTPQAGIDLRGGVKATNLIVEDYGSNTGLIGIRTQQGTSGVGTPSAVPAQSTTVNGFYCKANSLVGTSGLRSIIPYGKYSDGEVQGCEFGINLSYQDAECVNIAAIGNTNNYNHSVSSGVNPANHLMTNCTSRTATNGVAIRANASNISYVNSTNRGSTTGYLIEAGATDCSIIGGNCSNTTNVSDSGGNTYIHNVQGVKTYNKVVSAGIPIDSTGTKSFTINHGLAFTPSINDVSVSLQRDTEVGDWVCGFLWVTGTTSTQISGQIRITTASVSVGATVKVSAVVRCKS